MRRDELFKCHTAASIAGCDRNTHSTRVLVEGALLRGAETGPRSSGWETVYMTESDLTQGLEGSWWREERLKACKVCEVDGGRDSVAVRLHPRGPCVRLVHLGRPGRDGDGA